MEVKRSIKSAGFVVGLAALLSTIAGAQEVKSEISAEGSGFFTKDVSGNGIQQHATDAGGFLVGYRYNFNRWLSAEANYGYDRNTEIYSGGAARVQSNIHQITGSAVVKLPTLFRLQPYALAGGGGLVFDPTANAGGTFANASRETRGAFVYGVGADYGFTKHLAIRAEYRGYVYKAPDFNLASLNTDTWTHTAVPSAGFVFKF